LVRLGGTDGADWCPRNRFDRGHGGMLVQHNSFRTGVE
jgi:hypothetical protein